MPPIRPVSAAALVTAPAVAWAALGTMAAILAFLGKSLPSPIHGLVLVIVLTITFTAGFLWLRNLVAREHEVTRAVCAALADRIVMASPTQPLPSTTVVAGAAQVKSASDDELPGYSKGYVDGLSRKPMVDGKVVPIARN